MLKLLLNTLMFLFSYCVFSADINNPGNANETILHNLKLKLCKNVFTYKLNENTAIQIPYDDLFDNKEFIYTKNNKKLTPILTLDPVLVDKLLKNVEQALWDDFSLSSNHNHSQFNLELASLINLIDNNENQNYRVYIFPNSNKEEFTPNAPNAQFWHNDGDNNDKGNYYVIALVNDDKLTTKIAYDQVPYLAINLDNIDLFMKLICKNNDSLIGLLKEDVVTDLNYINKKLWHDIKEVLKNDESILEEYSLLPNTIYTFFGDTVHKAPQPGKYSNCRRVFIIWEIE